MVTLLVCAITKAELVTVSRGATRLIACVYCTTTFLIIFPALATWVRSHIG
jgi:hypothetical protein